MQDSKNQVIYIGKAKNLKNRIKSYFQLKTTKHIDLKTTALISEIYNIEITITTNEVEALLLENKLINQLKPKYNVIFRDDKSYPFILLTNEKYPSIRYFRNKNSKNNKAKGILYGPYPNIRAVKTSLDLLSKIFKLRSCNTNFFNNRTRPCLEYQLQRCTAPCVGLIEADHYAKDVENVKLFLQNKSKLLIKNLTEQMREAANVANYELAAKLRDQIKALSLLQNDQTIVNKQAIDVDVLGIAVSTKLICIHLLRVRQGDILYSRQFFSKKTVFTANNSIAELLEEFILQHYLKEPDLSISEILTSINVGNLENVKLISKTINIKLFCAQKGSKLAWQKIAQVSAEEALSSRVMEIRSQKNNFKILADLLGRDKPIERIVCFDVSHTSGKETIAACVVFNTFGKEQSSYRLFNIKTINTADDYEALQQAITRYMEQIIVNLNLSPDLLIVDGGKGQLGVAEKVIDYFKIRLPPSKLPIDLLGIAKGQARKFGLEKIYLASDGSELHLQSTHQVFKLLLRVRDEAHRFAISSHRKKRDKAI
jgi:excinuclease ABC subunit C